MSGSEPTVTIRQFVEDSYQLVSANTPTVPLHGNDLQKGIQYLNTLLLQYAANGLMLTVSKQVDFEVEINQGIITFGEATYIPTPDITEEGRLVNLENAWVSLENVTYPLIDISRQEFMSSYKYAPLSGLPRYIIVYPETNLTKVQIFPAPSQPYSLSVYGKFQLNKLTSNSTLSSLPTYYQLYLQFALAKYIAMFKGRIGAWNEILEATYRELKSDMEASSSVNLDINVNNESWLNGAWRVRAAVKELPIFTSYDVQRFKQFSPQDCSNWYAVQAPSGKKETAMYPAMGRKHINVLGQNVFVFDIEPRAVFRSIDFIYVVVGSTVYQYNKNFVQYRLINADFSRQSGPLYFAFLPTTQVSGDSSTQSVLCMMADGKNCYVINETTKSFTTVTDSNAPPKPLYVAAFGNRFAVSSEGSTQFNLTQINLGAPYNPATVFTVAGLAVFAQESGIIQQFAVLHNQLYIFTNYTTGIWSNTPSIFNATNTSFPWKKNTSWDWDYGMAAPQSLDVDFGMMAWLAQSRNGLVEFMVSDGQMPKSISTQAISVLLQKDTIRGASAGYLSSDTSGFLYQYEDSIFYRASAGSRRPDNTGFISESANSLEYNFQAKAWGRRTELNGTRNLINDHVFFAGKHIVSAIGQPALYEMSGNVYINELRNTAVGNQDRLAFIAYPFRYQLVTPIISEKDYSEFITDDIQIDFVWGDQSYIRQLSEYDSTVFLISQDTTSPGSPTYLISQESDLLIAQHINGTTEFYQSLDSTVYTDLYKPHIELLISDDGGISYYSADVLEFSQLGIYSWRMRWYQCGVSRNRCYKLICVSPGPVVILGATQNTRPVSGGAR